MPPLPSCCADPRPRGTGRKNWRHTWPHRRGSGCAPGRMSRRRREWRRCARPHVGRGHHVGSGIRMGARLAHQRLHGQVILNITGGVDQAVLPVGREGVERHVGDDPEAGNSFFTARTACCAMPSGFHDSRASSDFFSAGTTGTGQSPESEIHQRFALARELIDRQPLDARHRADRLALPGPLDHEDGVDQRFGAQVGFAHEPPRELVAPHAAHPGARKCFSVISGHIHCDSQHQFQPCGCAAVPR